MPFPEVKPNIKKVFLMNVVKIISAALGIILLAVLFVSIVGGEFFEDVFGGLGISIDFGKVIWWFVLAIVVIMVIILILNYLSLGNARYEFQPDKIVCYSSALFVLVNSKEIPYENISRINFSYDGFLNGVFNTGKITIELTAMKEKECKMEFIDNAEYVTKYIQKMVQDYKSRYYAQRTEEYRVGSIFDRQGF